MKLINKIILSGLILSFPFNINALSLVSVKDIKCTETEEYKRYKSLSKEEQDRVILPVMCEEFKNNAKNTGLVGTTVQEDLINSKKFDLRNVSGKNYVTSVKNQFYTNTCWAHSIANSIESNYLINGGNEINISELSLGYMLSYQLKDGVNPHGIFDYVENSEDFLPYDAISKGASLANLISLLGSRRGISSEEKTGLSLIDTSIVDSSNGLLEHLNIKSEYKVNDVYISIAGSCQENDGLEINTIKEMLVLNGAVYGTMYIDETFEGFSDDLKNYYYMGDNIPNHAISIVGWDDEYSKDNFLESNGVKPSGDGAFIVKNSYGTSVGDGGYHYISYYDVNLCTLNIAVDRVLENVDDYSYFYDNSSMMLDINSDTNSMLFANKYNKKDENVELLKNVTLFSLQSGDKYELYYSKDLFQQNYKLLSKGTFEYLGLTNIDVNTNTIVDDEFYIILKYIPSDVNNTIPIGVFASEYSSDALISMIPSIPIYPKPMVGVSYYSEDGENWADTVNDGLNMCINPEDCNSDDNNILLNFYPYIYTFTSAKNYHFSLLSVDNKLSNVADGGEIKYKLDVKGIDESKLKLKILNSKSEDITNEFKVTYDKDNMMFLVKAMAKSIEVGNYSVVISYDGLELKDEFYVGKKDILIVSLEINGDNEVYANGKLVLTTKINPIDATNQELIWKSSDENIAKVENGVVSGISEGNVTITATTTDGSNISASKTITVKGVPNSDIVGNPSDSNVSGSDVKNPQTGVQSYLIVLIFVLLVITILYRYINKKSYFKKYN